MLPHGTSSETSTSSQVVSAACSLLYFGASDLGALGVDLRGLDRGGAGILCLCVSTLSQVWPGFNQAFQRFFSSSALVIEQVAPEAQPHMYLLAITEETCWR